MDLWVIMSLFGTVLVTLGILSFIPGAATYIASFFQVITSFLRQGIQIVVDHLPKPLKLVLFVVLFVVLGGVAYNFTIGAPYICQSMACEQKIGTNATLCAQSNVVQTDWLTGVAFKILPHEDMVKWWSDQSKQQAVAAQANNMSATEPRVILNVEVSPGSSGTANVSTGRGLVTEDKNFVWKGDGNTYHVYRVLGAYFEDWVNLGDDFFRKSVV